MSICANSKFEGENYIQALGLELTNVILITLALDSSAELPMNMGSTSTHNPGIQKRIY
jgi:hypothetical protein